MAAKAVTWTVNTLKEHLESKISALEKNVATALAAADKAVTKAETAIEKRFDSGNEIRQAMVDAQGHFAQKEQTDLQFDGVDQRLKAIEQTLAAASGKSAGIGMLAAAIGTAIVVGSALLGLILKWSGA